MSRLGFFTQALTVALLAVSGCAGDHAEVRYERKVLNADDWIKVAKGVKAKIDIIYETPDSLFGESIVCRAAAGQNSQSMSLVPSGSLVLQVKIRNDTHHPVKLTSYGISLSDPEGNQYDALDKKNLKINFMDGYPCEDSPQLTVMFARARLIDGDFSILPARANRGYVVFKPKQPMIPGDWSASFHNLEFDFVKPLGDAGPGTFTYKLSINKHADVFTKIDWFGTSYLKTTKDLTGEGSADKALEEVLDARKADEAAAAKAVEGRNVAEKAAADAKAAADDATEKVATAKVTAQAARKLADNDAAAAISANGDAVLKATAARSAIKADIRAAAVKAAVRAAAKAAADADAKAEALRGARDVEEKTAEAAAYWTKWK